MALKMEMASWEELMLEEFAAFDAVAPEDEPILVDGESYEELVFDRDDRDRHRWELDPASAEDYSDRLRGWKIGPAQRWRHFGH